MSDVSAVSSFFATANEGFSTTLATTITSGATTVVLTSASGLTDGSVFVGIIEPGAANQQVFTGIVSAALNEITGVVWTRGTNVGHTSGVTIVDYTTGTFLNMITAGLLKQHNQDGTHSTVTTTGSVTVGSGLTVSAGTITAPTGSLSSKTLTNPYKFRVSTSTSQSLTVHGGWTTVNLASKDYDTGTNFNTTTHLFTAPIAGYYQFNTSANINTDGANVFGVTFLVNGTTQTESNTSVPSNAFNHAYSTSATYKLAAGDTVGIAALNGAGVDRTLGGAVLSGSLVSAT